VKRVAVLCLCVSMGTAADAAPKQRQSAVSDADSALADAQSCYDRALSASVFGTRAEVVHELEAARDARARAVDLYRNAATSGNDSVAQRHLAEALALGKTCCDKRSLWDEYGINADPRPAKRRPRTDRR
jgi:hypothetical protein